SQNIAAAEYWVTHIRQPVRFADSINTLDQENCSIFLEIGPKPVLLGMGSQCLLESQKLWLPSLRSGVEDWQQMLQSLAQLYVEGIEVDWAGVYSYNCANKVALPTYPFQRERYWIENNKANYQTKALSQAKKIHPLLGQRLRIPFSSQIRFESQLGIHSPAHQDHHRLFDIDIVAAASHISLVLSAVYSGWKTRNCIIEELLFSRPLVLPSKEIRIVQIVLEAENFNESSFKIISSVPGTENQDSSWSEHASGKVRLKQATSAKPTASPELEKIQQRCKQTVTKNKFYLDLYQAGYTLGTAFQWISKMWVGEAEALGKMELPKLPDEVDDYQLYPGLLDSCFQVLSRCWESDNFLGKTDRNQSLFIPFQIQSFQFFHRPRSNRLWCHAQKNHKYDEKDGILAGELLIWDEGGNIVAQVKGFEVRKVSQEALYKSLQPDLNKWFYQIHWQESSSPNPVISSEKTGTWLIFASANGWGEQIAKSLQQQHQCVLVYPGQGYQQLNERHYELCPTRLEDFRKLIQEVGHQQTLVGILHLWNLDTTIDALSKAQELSCGSVLHLLQAITSELGVELPSMWLITQGAQKITDVAAVQPQQASIWGLGRVIALEQPELNCRCLDLEVGVKQEEAIKILVSELLSPDIEDQIVYRQGLRRVARLTKARLKPENKSKSEDKVIIKSKGTYLITGGFGALGLELAQWMVTEGAKHIVLVGRSEPNKTAVQKIEELEKAGANVSVLKGDISQQEELVHILEQIEAFLPPLQGVIHAAGILDDGLLSSMKWEQFTKVMAPKVQGSWHLHQLTQHLMLDFFVCFSSMASILGSPGQGNYAAANAFMDALVYHRQSTGLPGLSINWGPWSQGGMAARLARSHQIRWQKMGVDSITTERGLQALSQWLNQSVAQVSVMPISWHKFLQQFEGKSIPPILSNMPGIATQNQSVPRERQKLEEFKEQLKSLNQPRRVQLLINYLTEIVIKILGLSQNNLPNPRKGFFDLGMDSLRALELSRDLKSDLGIALSSTAAFEYANIEELAMYLETILPCQEYEEDPSEPSDKVSDSNIFLSEVSQLSEEELDESIEQELSDLKDKLI
ncbi:short-chain dehydrogenase, partial [Pleurocapsa sp. CCALA 161]|uniref:type I polyketide synthase n=1 Tax=Pleurocapsa sp. CCALA 161 TaxID=2107688 RepID=UPI000D4DCB8A